MAQTFDCKEPGCTEKVTYNEQIVHGVKGASATKKGDTIIVRLKCDRGHWHNYEAKREG